MFHSHWEMEVFAREIQDLRLREAERQRSIAALPSIERSNALVAAAGRVACIVRSVFSGQPERQVEAIGLGAVGAAAPVFEAAKETAAAARPRVNPLTAPYAAMVVVARGPSATPAAQSSGLGDR